MVNLLEVATETSIDIEHSISIAIESVKYCRDFCIGVGDFEISCADALHELNNPHTFDTDVAPFIAECIDSYNYSVKKGTKLFSIEELVDMLPVIHAFKFFMEVGEL